MNSVKNTQGTGRVRAYLLFLLVFSLALSCFSGFFLFTGSVTRKSAEAKDLAYAIEEWTDKVFITPTMSFFGKITLSDEQQYAALFKAASAAKTLSQLESFRIYGMDGALLFDVANPEPPVARFTETISVPGTATASRLEADGSYRSFWAALFQPEPSAGTYLLHTTHVMKGTKSRPQQGAAASDAATGGVPEAASSPVGILTFSQDVTSDIWPAIVLQRGIFFGALLMGLLLLLPRRRRRLLS